jgi:alkylation response protein AidB-like acyl-CoA dehydrogenase
MTEADLPREPFSNTVPGVAAADEELRAELRSWLVAHPPPAIEVAATAEDAQVLRAWQRTMHDDGWVGIHWPTEYGGRGASVSQVAIYNEELARAGAPPLLGRAGITLVGPTLMAHGTEDQRAAWMPRILSGDDVWCQLFSEPDAGSDLAALSTRAEPCAGGYRVNGRKLWSSYATYADMGIALVRTAGGSAVAVADRRGGEGVSARSSARPHKGISMLAIPMDAPGVDVRPLRQMTGDCEFNEVFFDDVTVPVENRIGPENEGWAVANTTLANERGASFIWREQVLHEVAVGLLAKECAARGRTGDPRVRQRLAQSWIDAELFRLHNARTLARLARGDDVGAESSLVKLFWANTSQRLAETAVAVLGPEALLTPGRWANRLLSTRANSIMGGTSEIQRNVIGERLLELPREPR